MELFPAEKGTLEKMLADWIKYPERECEATFGIDGIVDATTFLNVAKRLKGRGYTELQQDDRLTVTTDRHERFTLVGDGVISQYCRDNMMAGKPYVAITKDRVSGESKFDLSEYNTRVKVCREIPLPTSRTNEILVDWANQKKAFRMIRRWTFEKEGEGFKFDLSVVYSTSRTSGTNNGGYRWVRKFLDEDIKANPPRYEIEAELIHSKENDDPAAAFKNLIKAIGEVLRGVQKNTLLIRNTVREQVLSSYKALAGVEGFRGVQPITLERKNIMSVKEDESTPTLYENYNVTDKADGLRVLPYCDAKGELFLIDQSFNVYRTGLQQEACKNSLLDGEWVTINRQGKGIHQLLLFDVYIVNEEKVDNLPFYKGKEYEMPTRYEKLTKWRDTWNKETKALIPSLTPATKLQVSVKRFEFANPGDKSIFHLAHRIYNAPSAVYNNDGLIFTPNERPLPPEPGTGFEQQFKWKPAHDNTIDFLVRIVKKSKESKEDLVETSEKAGSGETVNYKTLHLYVASRVHPSLDNPRKAVLYEEPLPEDEDRRGQRKQTRPILFNPKDFTDHNAFLCYREVFNDFSTGESYITTEGTEERPGEPIFNESIVEMRYDPSERPGWRWKPIRIRHDKTERYQAAMRTAQKRLARTMNSSETAENVWNSIHEPVTVSMITTGSEQPLESEIEAIRKSRSEREGITRRYYEREAAEEDLMLISGLREFHNKYVKEKILLRTGLMGGGKSIVDMSIGQGSDIFRFERERVSFVYGTDIAGFGITDPANGAYKRYLNMKITGRKRNKAVPPMVFTIGDSSKFLPNGEAGADQTEADIMRAVFGSSEPQGPIPPFVEKFCKNKLKGGADCTSIMFSIHYLFGSKDQFNGFLQNLNATVKLGGYFVGCCFDGESVHDMFRKQNIQNGGKVVGMENGKPIWSITRKYDYEDDFLPTDDNGFGLKIGVEFISLSDQMHDEYLVPFELLKTKLKYLGLELLTPEECTAVGLTNSTNMFKNSWDMAKAAGTTYAMSKAVSEYSFLNRWFIFKRKNMYNLTEEQQANLFKPQTPQFGREEVMKPDYGKPKKAESKEAESKDDEVSYPPMTPPDVVAQRMAQYEAEKKGDGVKTVTITPAAQVAEPGKPAGDGAPAKAVPTATTAAAVQRTEFELGDLFQFHAEAPLADKYGTGDVTDARWLAPIAAFPIKDGAVEYPSLEHYIAAMKYKYGAMKPDGSKIADSTYINLFSTEGKIHQDAKLRELRASAAGSVTLDEATKGKLMKEESDEIQKQLKASGFKKNKVIFNEANWAAKEDEVLREGVRQRWERDARFRRIVEKMRDKSKYLLYYTGAGGMSDYGGIRRMNKKIDGTNKLGKLIMEFAKYA